MQDSNDSKGSCKSCSADCEHHDGRQDSLKVIFYAKVSTNCKDEVDRQPDCGSDSDFFDSKTDDQSDSCQHFDQAENVAEVGWTANCFSGFHNAR